LAESQQAEGQEVYTGGMPAGVGSALTVDNPPVVTEQTRQSLIELGFTGVTVVSQTQDLLDHVRQAQPALVLLDILPPDGPAWDALRQLKANPETRSIPVVVLSAVDDRRTATSLGAAEQILKPFELSDFQQVVMKVLGPHQSPGDRQAVILTQSLTHKTVLIVEDNEVNILLMSDYLTSHGYNVLVARNGKEAIHKIIYFRPHIILMDIQMPGMDGIDATRYIRALPDTHLTRTPIIALTALAMPGDQDRCLAAGANRYISKPVNLDTLVIMMRKLMEES
jgi:CheY-like chemotaxis protein